jgi:phenylacetate-CoA ligase
VTGTTTLPTDARRYYDAESETMPRAAIEARQWDMLQERLATAYEHAPLYRDLWDDAGVRPGDLASLADFRARVPFVGKDVIRARRDRTGDPFGGLLTVPIEELTAIHSTSGTTGDPTLVGEVWGRDDTQASKARGGPVLTRDFWELGVRPGDHVGLMLFTYRGPIYLFPGILGATAMVFDHDAADVPNLLAWSRELRPTLLYNMSLATFLAVEEAAAEGVDVRDAFASYHAVIWAGEPIGPRTAERARALGIPLYFQSGAGDVGAATECRERDGAHLWEDYGIYECIDPETGDPVADGEVGELVATNLTWTPMPLFRHRSDDLVRMTAVPCACGRTHRRTFPLGRRGAAVRVDGRVVLPIDVWGAIESVDETRAGLFQVIRPGPTAARLRLRVGYRGSPETTALAARVADAVAATVGLEPEVELVPNEALLRLGPPHKIPRVSAR